MSTQAVTLDQDASRQASAGRAIFASTVGHILEQYDLTIYAAFAIHISNAFFPTGNETITLIVGFATFGIGYLARPIGAAFFGSYADRKGRSAALSLTILLMALGTGMNTFCPTYQSIGIAAPIIIIAARLIQGFSAGGEFGSAITILVENAPPSRRAAYAAFHQASQGGATFLSGLVALTISLSLTNAEISEWGWRLAFAFGLLIVPVGLWIRRTLAESSVFQQSQARVQAAHEKHSPVAFVFRHHIRNVAFGFLVVMLWTVAHYIKNYMPTFAVHQLKLSLTDSFLGGPFTTGIVFMFAPVIGLLADRFNRRSVMITGALLLLTASYPIFSNLVAHPTLTNLVVSQILFGFCVLVYAAPASAVLAEAFPTRVRATGVALSYSLGVTVFGGFTPVIVTALIGYTGQSIAIAYWLMAASGVALIALSFIGDGKGKELG